MSTNGLAGLVSGSRLFIKNERILAGGTFANYLLAKMPE
jgi:hypothetical protein